jgi:putative membrane protein
MLTAVIKKNDTQAKWLIGIFSLVVFTVIIILSNFKLNLNLGFNVHLFATYNAIINTIIAILLVVALIAVKSKKYTLHKNLMLLALVLSILFLVSYIAHHLLAGEIKFGGTGAIKVIYLIILFTHIFLAAIILPFILFMAYRALTAGFPLHKKIARYTWPLWLYVAVTGPIVYVSISPYYQ